ncbi:Clp protease/crotonase-like domain-containing protein [Trueperella abortisuis]|uniref:RNA-binding Zn-ribbon protein involved in translation (DUF1610 family) n=1 Tax=Trueperella abortisuis TaxID=445930 RepID=A0ABT9PKM7_9ACTO|nr:hypothetical protein [Trueperella abortisuis]MDP9833012.1 putative RNA-binding Zn-ribbon protein involved in translation (DUF1610 family) [Trueperella abortisuis]
MNKNPTITTICADLPTLYQHLLDLTEPTLHAIRYTAAHTTGTQADSLPERATYARERLEHELGELRQIAGVLADTDHGQTPIDKVAVVLAEHATTLAAWPDLQADVERIHARWKTAAAPDTEASDHLCPACGTTTLHWHHTERLYRCPACDYTGTVEHVRNAALWRIRSADLWVDRATACALFGLTRDQIKWHIRAGNLHPDGGLVSTAELRALPRRR